MICCNPCAEQAEKITKATKVAPQYEGGDENGLVLYVPICDQHARDWYENIPRDYRLRMFDLTKRDHRAHPDHSLVEDMVEGVALAAT